MDDIDIDIISWFEEQQNQNFQKYWLENRIRIMKEDFCMFVCKLLSITYY